MSRSRGSSSLLSFLIAALALGACGSESAPTETSGSLSLGLELAPGVEIDEVRWTITGGDMAPMSGTIDTSAPGATASVEVFGLPPGDDYLVELVGSSGDGGAICQGDAPFDVRAGEATDVMVMLNCKLPERLGGVRVNGKLNVCAELTKAVVSPLQTSVGNDIDLRAEAFDVEYDGIAFRWTASGGTIAQPGAPSTTYTCTVPGQHIVTIQVSDDDFRHCTDSWNVLVTCVGDGGGTGGTGGGGGSGACTNPEDASVYAELVYVNDDGATTFGTDAAAAIATDCVFGSSRSEPPNPGCGSEAGDVLNCSIQGTCTEEEISAVSNCVEECQQELIFEITGSTLTEDCNACYGDSVACAAVFCATSGCSNPTSPSCVACRCANGCIPGFATCSGIPDSTCDSGGTGGTGGGGGAGGAGGTGGGGGTGGTSGGACTTSENFEVYAELVYVDDDGRTTFGIDAAAAIASECVFGSSSSEPQNPGCPSEAGSLLACIIGGNCSGGEIEALSTCVEACQQELIVGITATTLTEECNACYGEEAVCTLALCATSGCSDPSSPSCIACRCETGCLPSFAACTGFPDDTCDNGGTGGTGGAGGTGGFGGGGGTGGTGIDPLCEPQSNRCTDGQIDEHTPCCEQVVPQQASACLGDESVTNPTSCTPTDETITYQWTVIETASSCNAGYDLDSCDGITCDTGGLAPFEGLDGVDNALTGLAPILAGVGGNLSGLNQAFSDGICGLTDDFEQGICVGGDNDGRACTSNLDCPGLDAFCQLDDGDCQVEIPPIDIRFIVDANFEENCANVRIDSSGEISDTIVNLGDLTNDGTACMSGAFGAIPLTLVGVPSVLGNVVVRTTISEAGFTDGLVGSTVDATTAVTIAELLLEGAGAVVSQVFDINETLTQDTSAACNAMSATFTIGGATVETLR